MSIEEIRAKYGDVVADKVVEEIDSGSTEAPFNIFIDNKSNSVHYIYFATKYYVSIFEVDVHRKRLFTDGKKTLYLHETRKAFELMKGFEQAD